MLRHILESIASDFERGITAREILFRYNVSLVSIELAAKELRKRSTLYRTIQAFLAAARLLLIGPRPVESVKPLIINAYLFENGDLYLIGDSYYLELG